MCNLTGFLYAIRRVARVLILAPTKELVNSFGDVRPGGGALKFFRGWAREEIIVVNVRSNGRASGRVRAPSSNVYVLAQIAAAGAVIKITIITRHSVVDDSNQFVVVVRCLPGAVDRITTLVVAAYGVANNDA